MYKLFQRNLETSKCKDYSFGFLNSKLHAVMEQKSHSMGILLNSSWKPDILLFEVIWLCYSRWLKNTLQFLVIHLYILRSVDFFPSFSLVCLFPECIVSSRSVLVSNPEFIRRKGCGRGHLRWRNTSINKRRKF